MFEDPILGGLSLIIYFLLVGWSVVTLMARNHTGLFELIDLIRLLFLIIVGAFILWGQSPPDPQSWVP